MAARQKPIYSNKMKHKICQKISEGKNAHTIADELGLEYNHDTFSSFISKVKNNKIWHEIVNQYDFAPKVESKHGGFHRGESNYSEDTVRKICKSIAEGKNSTEAANAIGVEKTPAFYTLFSTIKNKKRWTSISNEYF